jgi:hypothetical protein
VERYNFCKWFWTSPNGKKLIESLNYCEHRNPKNYFVSLGKRPYVYVIVLNYPYDLKDGKKKWKFCKIGLTQGDTTQGTGNRMEQVMKQIDDKYKCNGIARVLLCLPIDPTDPRILWDVEDDIRDAFGHEVSNEKAQELQFPVHTEWVLTTQRFINHIKDKIKEMKKHGYATTKVVFENKFPKEDNPLPAALEELKFPSEQELRAFAEKMSKPATPGGLESFAAMSMDD